MTSNRNHNLHLPNLAIANFRGIRNLKISQLGRVTLLTGRNGVGKTTVLEAVRVYAARGHEYVLQELLLTREEFAKAHDEDRGLIWVPDYATLFYGRRATYDQPISIGPISGRDNLRVAVTDVSDLSENQQTTVARFDPEADTVLKVVCGNAESVIPWSMKSLVIKSSQPPRFWSRNLRREGKYGSPNMPDPIDFSLLGPGLPSNDELAEFWDDVALTEEEPLMLKALGLTKVPIVGVAVVGEGRQRFGRGGRRIVVKIGDQSERVPLKSLGDGATRLFAASLALVSNLKGFLLIDEVENGIHHSILFRFWEMIMKAAKEFDVQVIATTHSFDCVKAFAQAAAEDEEEGVLVRLQKKGDDVRAIEYTEEDLEIASKQKIEVR
ncbi:MAG: AAA family ATPase [Bacteroidota bacterium]|nr:AAA family ATPase [Bacteroidota bacterium]MXW15681.1 AAA family ATPase [Rhodothermaceae bacterium]MYC04911.1 AAA family ATPase [Rhodothermaceae bacterium]MYI16853.1 AAA family ATPase [Rhodothermaceae bacterium]